MRQCTPLAPLALLPLLPLRALLALLTLLATPSALRAQSGTPPPVMGTASPAGVSIGDVAQLRWLAGCWEARTPTRVTQESWIAPAGGLMLGVSRTVVRDVAREFEFLRIELRDGTPTYVAQPGGGPATAFSATVVSDTAVRFENPQHDFPQGIAYRRVGTDSLVASIDGPQGGVPRTIRFPMRRIGCAP